VNIPATDSVAADVLAARTAAAGMDATVKALAPPPQSDTVLITIVIFEDGRLVDDLEIRYYRGQEYAVGIAVPDGNEWSADKTTEDRKAGRP